MLVYLDQTRSLWKMEIQSNKQDFNGYMVCFRRDITFMTLLTKYVCFKKASPTLLSELTIVTFRNFFLIDSAKFG